MCTHTFNGKLMIASKAKIIIIIITLKQKTILESSVSVFRFLYIFFLRSEPPFKVSI